MRLFPLADQLGTADPGAASSGDAECVSGLYNSRRCDPYHDETAGAKNSSVFRLGAATYASIELEGDHTGSSVTSPAGAGTAEQESNAGEQTSTCFPFHGVRGSCPASLTNVSSPVFVALGGPSESFVRVSPMKWGVASGPASEYSAASSKLPSPSGTAPLSITVYTTPQSFHQPAGTTKN